MIEVPVFNFHFQQSCFSVMSLSKKKFSSGCVCSVQGVFIQFRVGCLCVSGCVCVCVCVWVCVWGCVLGLLTFGKVKGGARNGQNSLWDGNWTSLNYRDSFPCVWNVGGDTGISDDFFRPHCLFLRLCVSALSKYASVSVHGTPLPPRLPIGRSLFAKRSS